MKNLISIVDSYYTSTDKFDVIIEYIYEILDNKNIKSLTEASNLMDLSEFQPIIESVENIKEIENDLETLKAENDLDKREGLFTKLMNSLKGLWSWYYKVDPDKKFKTLHLILRILFKVLMIVLVLYSPGSKPLGAKIATKLPDIGYKGANKVLRKSFGKQGLSLLLVRTIYANILSVLSLISDKVKINMNKKDIDKAINEYEKVINEVNKKLETEKDQDIRENLEIIKKNNEEALAELTRIKDIIK